MLVLSRKQKQQIRIGDDVVLTVLQVKGNTVRIGIEAPKRIHVVRGELIEQDAQAAQNSTKDAEVSSTKTPAASTVKEYASSNYQTGEFGTKHYDSQVIEYRIQGGGADSGSHGSSRPKPSGVNRLAEMVRNASPLNTQS